MADATYDEGRNTFLGGWTHSAVDLNNDTIKELLRDEGTTALNLSTQVDLADISAAGVGTDQTVAGATVGSVGVGVFDHTITTWSAVSGASVESIDVYKSSGVATTSPLIWNIDSATGLPVTPNGGDITFDPAAGGLYVLNS